MGYTKLFDSMWSGSLYGKFEASAVFMVMLSLADAEGQVDMTHEAIAGRTGWPIDFIREGIHQLEQPDERSRTPDADGRRIILITEGRGWGWFITNYAKYRDEMRSAERREYLREAKRKERDKRRQQLSTGQPESTTVNPSYAYADSEAEALKPKKLKATRRAEPPDWFVEFKSIYPRRAGDPDWAGGLRAANQRITEGHDPREFAAGARRYAAYIQATQRAGTDYIQQASRFLGPSKPFTLAWDAPAEKESLYEEMIRMNGGKGMAHATGTVFESEPSRPALAGSDKPIRG